MASIIYKTKNLVFLRWFTFRPKIDSFDNLLSPTISLTNSFFAFVSQKILGKCWKRNHKRY